MLIKWSDGTTRIQLLPEVGGVSQTEYNTTAIANIGSQTVTLILELDPASATVTGRYQLNGGAVQTAASGVSVPGSWFSGLDHDANGGTAPVSFLGLSATHGTSAATPITFHVAGFSISSASAPLPTATPTPPSATPTATATATSGPTATSTPASPTPTSTSEATATSAPVSPTPTHTSTPTVASPTPTHTSTPITPVSGTATALPSPSATPDSSGGTRTTTYSYDGLNRLTGAIESGDANNTYAYSYDPVGNRTSATRNGATTTREYDAASQVAGWTYDANGRLIADDQATYDYDALDRLLRVSQAGSTTSFTYNGDSELVGQTADGIAQQYALDVGGPLSQILQSRQGSATTSYFYGTTRIGASDGSTSSWYTRDPLGSVRQVWDAGMDPAGTLRYDPWGAPTGTTPDPFGFAGELQLPGGGLTYLRARWYQPGTGNFLTPDPVGGVLSTPYSQHRYQYAYSSPLRYTDPSGRFILPFLAAIGIGATIGAGLNYGWQVYQNYQHGLRGWDALTQVCGQEIWLAALSGGVAGRVGFLLGPLGRR